VSQLGTQLESMLRMMPACTAVKLGQKVRRQVAAPRLLRTPEAARYLGISPWKLRALVYSGEIAIIKQKYWLFSTDDLDKWIAANRERRLM